MSLEAVLLPGDTVPASQLPASSQRRRLGRGLQHDGATGSTRALVAGRLNVDGQKRTASVDTPRARYVPAAGDLVVGQVRHSSADTFHVSLTAHTALAVLPQLAFEGATKRTRPQLRPHDAVYARVTAVQHNADVELACINPATGRADPDGLGPLAGGMLFDVSTGFAARILHRGAEGGGGVVVLDELGDKLPGGFEVAVGKNGRVWVDCPEAEGEGETAGQHRVRAICAVGRCLQETDQRCLNEREQKKLVARVVAELGFR